MPELYASRGDTICSYHTTVCNSVVPVIVYHCYHADAHLQYLKTWACAPVVQSDKQLAKIIHIMLRFVVVWSHSG